ncbi:MULTISPECIES: hypothetical protein [unclassified Corallococcus]|uniref:hypothetical protein n=1 Tax=unclassified Corallococcus TaxID=2685029 RepID=UPI001A8CCA76|nr:MULTISPECIES: hypothetical protein [unclassified Corallococcus]MBN9684969.1 hypothetical protein [Corallococcus sp. NCSPR001]WAS83569.1 hypothetical protein O0N60_30175 [Corallococcus sp. NCRR]
MKRYFGIIIVIALVIIAAVASHRTASARATQAERDADFRRIQAVYLERVGWMRTNPDEASYKDELKSFFKGYFDDVDAHLDRFHGNKKFDNYLAELEQREASGGDKKDNRAGDRKAFYDYARKQFDALKDGRYRPVMSATDKGMRLDIVSNDVVMVMGKPQIRLQLVLWGAQRVEKDEGKLKKMVTSASFDTVWKLTDAKGKLLGEMRGADPSMKIDYPERLIAEFPPQMVLGHYDLDLLPAEVAKLEMTINVASHAASGGNANATYAWKLDVPSEWKLGANETWEGATQEERPEEEIDPAKASAKKGE